MVAETASAALAFGVLWSLWHLPLVPVTDTYQAQVAGESTWFALNFFLSVVPLGILVGWVWARNGKSIAAAVVFRFMVNASQEALSTTQATKCIETVVLVAVTAAIVLFDRRLFFGRGIAGAERLEPPVLERVPQAQIFGQPDDAAGLEWNRVP